MPTCPHCKAEMQTDGVNSWCVQADCAADYLNDFDDDDGDYDDENDWEQDCG